MRTQENSARTLDCLIPALGFALAAFLLQDSINFAFFVPASRTTFVAVFALCISRSHHRGDQANSPSTRMSQWIPPAVSASVLVITVFGIANVFPTERALAEARHGSETGRYSPRADTAFLDARRLDPLDPTASAEHARYLMHAVRNLRNEANLPDLPQTDSVLMQLDTRSVEAIDEAIDRAPNNHGFHRLKAQIHLLRFRAGMGEDVPLAVNAMRRALDLYPSRPRTHIELADCLVQVKTCDAMQEALDHLRRALELDSMRPDWEKLRRFNQRTLAEIEQRFVNIDAVQRDRGCSLP